MVTGWIIITENLSSHCSDTVALHSYTQMLLHVLVLHWNILMPFTCVLYLQVIYFPWNPYTWGSKNISGPVVLFILNKEVSANGSNLETHVTKNKYHTKVRHPHFNYVSYHLPLLFE